MANRRKEIGYRKRKINQSTKNESQTKKRKARVNKECIEDRLAKKTKLANFLLNMKPVPSSSSDLTTLTPSVPTSGTTPSSSHSTSTPFTAIHII